MRQSFYYLIRMRERIMGVSVESLEEEVLGEGIGKIALKSLGEGVFWERPQGGPKRPLPYTTLFKHRYPLLIIKYINNAYSCWVEANI